ncbi:MAG: insulinase family protein [Bernardetiaceae bacterium]|nr:insulinase family protein [Bernardetiaceae bacterium]
MINKKQHYWILALIALYFIGFDLQAQRTDVESVEIPSLDSEIPLDSRVKRGVLENGVTYYIQPNNRPENRVELRLVINAGSILEDDDQQGLAHFLEHMAFNGTKNFKKNELVSYLQSAGVKFGADLNAYTSFDETVYMLPLPTDDKKLVETGFQILADWANGILNEQEDIDDERGVVIEEWRMRDNNASARMMRETIPYMLKDSRYAKRFPIGKVEILENFTKAEIKRFYDDWYRPDLTAVIVVGDIEPAEAEAYIKKYFAPIPKVENAKERITYDIPGHKETLVKIATDPEATSTQVQLMYKHDAIPVNTLADYREQLVRNLYTTMIILRLQELRQQADPPFLMGYSYYAELLGRGKEGYQSLAIAPNGGAERALRAILMENERISRFGFNEGELERAKKMYLAQLEAQYNEREKTESGSLAMEYAYHYLKNSPTTGPTFDFAFAKKYLPEIKLEEVNILPKKWITEENRVLIVTAPDKEGVEIPTEESLLKVFEEVANAEIENIEDGDALETLMEMKPTPGSIVAEKELKKIDTKELTLSNGARIVMKKTDFKDDEIRLSVFSRGGTSLYPDEDYFNANYANAIITASGIKDVNQIALDRYMSDKNASVRPYIGSTTEGFSASASPKDMETMFEMLHLYFTAARQDEDAFASFVSRQKAQIENLLSSPDAYFGDQFSRFMQQDHFRSGYPSIEDIESIELNRAYKIFKERFSNAGDFTFVFVGNFDEDKLKEHLKTYIASLPSTDKKENWKDLGIRAPQGKHRKEIRRGSADKSTVYITYTGETKYDANEDYLLNSLSQLLDIKLIESLRESEGGVYTVRSSASMSQIPYESYSFTINFPCAPDNVNKLIGLAVAEIENIKKGNIDEKDMAKIKEEQRRELEVDLKNNRYWTSYLRATYLLDKDPNRVHKKEKAINKLKSKDLVKVAQKYLTGENYIEFILLPEGYTFN